MKYIIASVFMLFMLASCSFAGSMGIGVNYGIVNNFKMWDSSATDAGSLLRVDYSYAVNSSYTAALQLGFFADQNVINNAPGTTMVETAAFLNIANLLYLKKLGPIDPYFKIETGLYGVNSWRKQNDKFYSIATNVMADMGLGMGGDFNVFNVRTNLELTFPALVHVALFKAKLPYIINLGVKVPI